MDNFEVITLSKKGITDFAEERNMLLAKAKKEWVFFLDSDEKISPDLRVEINNALKKNDYDGFCVVRRDFLYGKELKHGEFSGRGWFGSGKILRLARRNAGKWEREVHEVWKVKGRVGILKNPLYHYPHKELKSFISSINHFSILHARALKREGKQANFLKTFIWPAGKFIYNYIFRLGFLDGAQGVIVAFMMSFHSFLSWSELWLEQRGK